MPRVTLYIRDSDYEKWKLIDNKAELVSQAINRSVISVVEKRNGTLKTNQQIAPPLNENVQVLENGTVGPVDITKKSRLTVPAVRPLDTPTTIEDKLANMRNDSLKYCKEGHAIPPGRSRCMGKGCKYA